MASAGRAHNSFFHDFSSCWNLKTLTAEMYQNRLFQPQLQQDSAGFSRIGQIPAWHPPRAAPNALPAGLPSSQRYASQRLPIGSCPTYGGQAAVQPGSDPQASPSATCQGAARKGWKSASSSHLTLRRNGASSGHAGTSAVPSLLGVLTQGRRCQKQRCERITSATSSASCPSSTYWGYGRIPASQRFLWLSDGCHYI